MASQQFAPQYRLTVYAGKSVDINELTALTPAANAPHANPFLVASATGVTSSTGGTMQPYLGLVTGRRGRLDPLTKHVDIGQLTVPILDVKAGQLSDQTTRWVTAFLGSVAGTARMMGLKVLIEENLGDGTGWTNFFTGRITAMKLADKLQYQITMQDMTCDMQVPVFVGTLSTGITGYTAQLPSLLPAGLVKSYGSYPVQSKMGGPIKGTTPYKANGVTYNVGTFVLDSTSRAAAANIITSELANALPNQPWTVVLDSNNLGLPLTGTPVDVGGFSRARAHVSSSSAGSSGDFYVLALNRQNTAWGQIYSRADWPSGLILSEVSTGDPAYLAMPADGTLVQASVTWDGPQPNDANWTVIDSVHPVALWRDLLDGFYGYLWKYGEQLPAGVSVGAAKRKIAYSTAQFSTSSTGAVGGTGALVNDLTLINGRFIIPKKARLDQWIETNIQQPWQLSYYLNGSGQVVPVDLRRPTSLPALTIVDDDIVDGQTCEWMQDRQSAVTRILATYYEDWSNGSQFVQTNQANWPQVNGLPSIAGFFQSIPDTVELLDIGNADANEKELTIDAQGFRASPGETLNNVSAVVNGVTYTYGLSRLVYLRQQLQGYLQNLQQPYGSGAMTITLSCRRTANTNTCQPGDTRLLTVTSLPDPNTNKRGGTRLVRCVERSEAGPTISLMFVDLGVNVTASVPTLGIVSQSTGDPKHGFDCAVTLNASTQVAELHYNVQSSTFGAGAPTANDSGWTFLAMASSTRTLSGARLPAGNRVFVRGRTNPGHADALQLPSSWIPASSNGYVDLAVLPGPTGLSAVVGLNQVVLNWTPGSSDLRSEIRLAQPSTGVLATAAFTPPNQSAVTLGLLANSTYGADVRHVDGLGGLSTSVSVTFASSSGATNTAPILAGFGVLKGA